MIMTPIIPTREDLEIFIYERHKDAYGVKGRHYDFDSMSYYELDVEAIRIDEVAKEQERWERKCDAEALIEFRARVRKVMAFCNCNRSTAIRYILDGEGHVGEYDASYICYTMGLPYSAAKYLQPRLTELNSLVANDEELVEKYDDLEVA